MKTGMQKMIGSLSIMLEGLLGRRPDSSGLHRIVDNSDLTNDGHFK